MPQVSDYNVWHILLSAVIVVVVGLFSVFWASGRSLIDTIQDTDLIGSLLLTTVVMYVIAYFLMPKSSRTAVDNMYLDENEFN